MRGTRGPRLVDAEPSYSFECPLVRYPPATPRGWNETEVEIAAACQCRASWLQSRCLQISNITFDSYDSFRWENWVWPFVSFSLLTCHIFQLHHTSHDAIHILQVLEVAMWCMTDDNAPGRSQTLGLHKLCAAFFCNGLIIFSASLPFYTKLQVHPPCQRIILYRSRKSRVGRCWTVSLSDS